MNRMRELRTKRGLDMKEAAKRIGMPYTTYVNYEKGAREPKLEVLIQIAKFFGVSVDYLIGNTADPKPKNVLPTNALPYTETHFAPILGVIPAGYPVLAVEDIEGYAPISCPDEENYFFLRVRGTSMIGAGIKDGDLVLVRFQDFAEDGQIVAACVNGDEATLKRYKIQGDMVILLPENPAFDPQIVPTSDFGNGNAQILGVAIEVRHNL